MFIMFYLFQLSILHELVEVAFVSHSLTIVGKLARKLYEHMKMEAAAIQIQKYLRGYQARKIYVKLRFPAILVQTGFRAMAARNEYRFRRQSKAAIIIQVCHSLLVVDGTNCQLMVSI